MPSISCCTRPHVLFQSLANGDVKVNKTQIISGNMDRFRTGLIISILMRLIFKVKQKEKFEFAAEQVEKKKHGKLGKLFP